MTHIPTPPLAPLAECQDVDHLSRARDILALAHAGLESLIPKLKSWNAAERLGDITGMLEEEIAGLASLAASCADQEELDRRDWRAIAWATYHNANRE